jgi:hypothetical protein
MVVYNCFICDYKTTKKYDYKRHINTKKHINNTKLNYVKKNTHIHPDTPIDTLIHPLENFNDIYCEYCNNKTLKKHKIRHYLNSCIKIPDKIKNNLIKKHNKNGNTLLKIDLLPIGNPTKIINNTLNNNNNTNNINNIVVNVKKLNPFGLESIEHISLERMIEIMNSKHKMIKEYCKDLYKLPENKNAYIDLRNKLVFFVDKDKSIEIETMSSMLSTMVESHIETINKYYEKHKDKLSLRTQTLFKHTYNTYFCIININNIDIEDEISRDSKMICSLFNDDIKTSLIKVRPDTKYLSNEEILNNNMENLNIP